MKRLGFFAATLAAILFFSPALCGAAYADDYTITIKDQQFSPREITVPANQKITITLKNTDATPAEFESSDLNREKIVTAGGEIKVLLGPLDAGRYEYFNDFHRDSTGTVIVK